MKKNLVILILLLALLGSFYLLLDSGQANPGVIAPDSMANDLRVNGVFELDVYPYVPWEGEYVQVICTIAPLGRFHVGAKDTLAPGFRHVRSSDGACDGWTWLP